MSSVSPWVGGGVLALPALLEGGIGRVSHWDTGGEGGGEQELCWTIWSFPPQLRDVSMRMPEHGGESLRPSSAGNPWVSWLPREGAQSSLSPTLNP